MVGVDGEPVLDEPHPGGNTSTLVVHRDAALSLLPVSNEIFFHALREAGRGIALRNPLTFYRVHPRSMTDRSTPGVSQDYRADVCLAISNRLRALRKNPPAWATVRQLGRISWRFRVLASGHKVESAIQRKDRLFALFLIPEMLIGILRARTPVTPFLRSLSSVLTGRPLVRLAASPGQEAHS